MIQVIEEALKASLIHDEIYQQSVGTLREGLLPSCAQLYFLKAGLPLEVRTMQSNLNPLLHSQISEITEEDSTFMKYYRTAREQLNASNLVGSHRVILNPQTRQVFQEETD